MFVFVFVILISAKRANKIAGSVGFPLFGTRPGLRAAVTRHGSLCGNDSLNKKIA
ncbi:hypothetical protein DDI_1527 [Dickeya dianthicola RNS04.9]|nr:hypothetical protein DDI_1527 [Dickeya dianthicola RNS04.9]